MKKLSWILAVVVVLCGVSWGVRSAIFKILNPQTTDLVISTGVKSMGIVLELKQLEIKIENSIIGLTDNDGDVHFFNIPVETKWEIINHTKGFKRVFGKSGPSGESLTIELPKGTSYNRIGFLLKEEEKEKVVTVSGFVRGLALEVISDLVQLENIEFGKEGETTIVGWVPNFSKKTGNKQFGNFARGTIAIVTGPLLTEENYNKTGAELIHVQKGLNYLMQKLILVFPDAGIQILKFK